MTSSIADSGLSTASTAFTRQFIEQRAATFHGAFGVESHYNTDTSEYQPKEIFELEETLKRYQRQPPHQREFNFDLTKCTWENVFEELNKAQNAASESNLRGKKFHRKTWRAIGEMAGPLVPGLAAIPSDLCVLQGGLAVMFSIARQRSQDRQKILLAFQEIPNVIIMAYGKAMSIPRDRQGGVRLHDAIGKLQQTLIESIPVLIGRLNPGTFVEKLMSPLKGFEIDDILGTVRASAAAVLACANDIMDNILVNAHKTIHENHKLAQQTEEEVGELSRKIEEILKHQKSYQLALDAANSKTSLLSLLTELIKKPEQREESMSSKESSPVQEPGTQATPSQLLDAMNVHHLRAIEDEKHIIAQAQSLGIEAITRATAGFQSTQVQQLLHSPQSGVVLVNGFMDRAQISKITTITHVCANLAHVLNCSADNVALRFYCGQHSTSQDDLEGPQGLMRSLVTFLIWGLLQKGCISISAPIWLSGFQGDLDELSFRDTCQIFCHLVELVPKEVTIYCIVDGISYYERDNFEAEYNLMMECLGSIIASTSVVFKLILTSATKSSFASKLQPCQVVSLRNLRMRKPARSEDYF